MQKIILPDFFNKGTPDKRKAKKVNIYAKKVYREHDYKICNCGCNTFKVVIEIIIDDAVLVCSSCGKQQ